MTPPWIDRIFDDRYAVVRALVLSSALVADVLLLHRPSGPGDWSLAVCAVTVCVTGSRWTLAVVPALAALVVAAHTLGAGVVPALKVLASLTLFDLTVRQRGRRPVVGAAALALAVVVNRWDDLPGDLPSVLYKAAFVAGLPLLVGAYVRMLGDVARQARARAAEEERRGEQRIAAARAAERTAIARELHDLVAHHVSSMVLRVGIARHVIPASDGDPRVSEVFDDLHASGSAALADLRRLVAVLRDPDGPTADSALAGSQGLPTALRTVAQRGRHIGLTVDLAMDPGVAGLDAVRALAVLRLAQEGLANTAKHAGTGTRVQMSVRVSDDDTVRVTVCDDGGGRSAVPDRVGPLTGHGLIGMHERVDLLGGRLDVGPQGYGWRLSAELPAEARTRFTTEHPLEPQR
ncbi:sensor histidine kinase [Streptomyces sp. NPDC053048]|uniref:sensor histidine kinase n=1 Tax=Streptomyces sp. NPDC053048 TaxID=3365694 RepID=UPI0037D6EB95